MALDDTLRFSYPLDMVRPAPPPSHVGDVVGVTLARGAQPREQPEPCPKCGAPMVLRRGRGQFFGCSNFATTQCKGKRKTREALAKEQRESEANKTEQRRTAKKNKRAKEVAGAARRYLDDEQALPAVEPASEDFARLAITLARAHLRGRITLAELATFTARMEAGEVAQVAAELTVRLDPNV